MPTRWLLPSLICTVTTAALCTGCANFDRYDPLALDPERTERSLAEAQTQRSRFQTEGDAAALNWLLAHEVANGMTVQAVNSALGETGERMHHDLDLKTHGGQYQQTDVGYKWGPDTNGRSVVLFFRDGKLVNFDPDEFRK